jgi:hypothetical protein
MSDKPMSHTEGGPAKIQTAKAPAESTTQVLSLNQSVSATAKSISKFKATRKSDTKTHDHTYS